MFKLFSFFRSIKGKKKNPFMSFSSVLIVTSCVLFAAFLIIDSDFLYYNWMQGNKQDAAVETDPNNLGLNGAINGGPNGENGLLMEGSAGYGLNMMMLNKMADGYCKDFLMIAQKHSDGEAMQEKSKQKDKDGNDLTLSVGGLVGMSVAESGTWDGKALGIPKSLINIESYGKPSGSLSAKDMTFYSLNHKSYKKANQKDLYSGYWVRASDAPTITTYQIHHNYMALPSEHMHKSKGKDNAKPSLMNGYGISEGTVRGIDETDAAFLPDLMSYILCNTLRQAAAYPDKSFTSDGLTVFASIGHNSGFGSVVPKMVYAQKDRPQKTIGDAKEKELTVKYLNEMANAIKLGSERDSSLLQNMVGKDSANWRSYIAGVLMSEDGYRMGDYCYETGWTYLVGSNSRAACLYFGLTGKWDPNVARQTVRKEYEKYKPFVLGTKYNKSAIKVDDGNCGYLYKEHNDAQITGKDGKQAPACTVINLITLAHISSLVSAPYNISLMAKYAGYDVKPGEVFIDNSQFGGGVNNPNEYKGTPNKVVRKWFINAAKEVDKGAIKDPEKYYGQVYDNMSAFAKMMLTNWYWYTDSANGKLQGCDYLWGGQCYRAPDNVSIDQIRYGTPAGDNGNSFYHFKDSCQGRKKRYGFDCAGLVRTMTSDVLPNGILASGNSTSTTFKTYAAMDKAYGGYYGGKNPLGIGPLFKGGYTFSSGSNFTKMPITMQPFDIVGHDGHILFFICWIDQADGRMLTLEATTGGQHTGLHSTAFRYSLDGQVGLIQFDHNNAYKYIMSDLVCTDSGSNKTTKSNHNQWNNAKTVTITNPTYMGQTKNGGFLNSKYLGWHGEGMKNLSF